MVSVASRTAVMALRLCLNWAAHWASEVLGVAGSKPYVAPLKSKDAPAETTVSLGRGRKWGPKVL